MERKGQVSIAPSMHMPCSASKVSEKNSSRRRMASKLIHATINTVGNEILSSAWSACHRRQRWYRNVVAYVNA